MLPTARRGVTPTPSAGRAQNLLEACVARIYASTHLRCFFSHRTFLTLGSRPSRPPATCKRKASRRPTGGDPNPSIRPNLPATPSLHAAPSILSSRLAAHHLLTYDSQTFRSTSQSTSRRFSTFGGHEDTTWHSETARIAMAGRDRVYQETTSTPAYGPSTLMASTDRRHWVSSFQFDTRHQGKPTRAKWPACRSEYACPSCSVRSRSPKTPEATSRPSPSCAN
ncbi:hypothetical protein AOQ84DRAFT_367655 [Glonium stellatum]|uniref:Uncharacterized protein n=1 Tax=Glonium stellatum TaxID=574774 RepID=A0A8E2ETC6_9PEZI|nr:hypothetical protein AOQ84DRAFT_367655 [Glonium stellatum]